MVLRLLYINTPSISAVTRAATSKPSILTPSILTVKKPTVKKQKPATKQKQQLSKHLPRYDWKEHIEAERKAGVPETQLTSFHRNSHIKATVEEGRKSLRLEDSRGRDNIVVAEAARMSISYHQGLEEWVLMLRSAENGSISVLESSKDRAAVVEAYQKRLGEVMTPVDDKYTPRKYKEFRNKGRGKYG